MPVLRPQNYFLNSTFLPPSHSPFTTSLSFYLIQSFSWIPPPSSPTQWPSCNNTGLVLEREVVNRYLSVNYLRYQHADFFIRCAFSRQFQRYIEPQIWSNGSWNIDDDAGVNWVKYGLIDVKLALIWRHIGVIDVILALFTPWPIWRHQFYEVLMIWNHVFINYSGTVEDIDLPFFLWHSPHRGGSDEPKLKVLGSGTQEEKTVKVCTDRLTLLIYIYRFSYCKFFMRSPEGAKHTELPKEAPKNLLLYSVCDTRV